MNTKKYGKLKILYEDSSLIVVVKPSGMLSVPFEGSRGKTVLDILSEYLRSKGAYSENRRPFAVHRLDKDTSGILVFALQEGTQLKMMNHWQEKVVKREYCALVKNQKGKKLSLEGTIAEPLAYNVHNMGYVPQIEDRKLLKEKKKLQDAKTLYRLVVLGKNYSLVYLQLETGKKNQIRAHLAYAGFPLVGDIHQKNCDTSFPRLCLHARGLSFYHPITDELLEFIDEEPAEWSKLAKNELLAKNKKEKNKFTREDSKNELEKLYAKNPSHKELRKMDFISRGKSLCKN